MAFEITQVDANGGAYASGAPKLLMGHWDSTAGKYLYGYAVDSNKDHNVEGKEYSSTGYSYVLKYKVVIKAASGLGSDGVNYTEDQVKQLLAASTATNTVTFAGTDSQERTYVKAVASNAALEGAVTTKTDSTLTGQAFNDGTASKNYQNITTYVLVAFEGSGFVDDSAVTAQFTVSIGDGTVGTGE